MTQFSEFVSWVFYGLISFAFYRIDKNLGDVSKGVENLNLSVALEIQKNSAIKESIEEIKQKIREMNHRLVAVEVAIATFDILNGVNAKDSR
jgi:hypothetical protein